MYCAEYIACNPNFDVFIATSPNFGWVKPKPCRWLQMYLVRGPDGPTVVFFWGFDQLLS